MRKLMRNSDVKCRYGGEEFLILLPDSPYDGAVHVAESLRKQIGKTSVLWNGETVSTTVGVASAQVGELDVRALIGRADAALYRAKNEGRNRVCIEANSATTADFGVLGNIEAFPKAPEKNCGRATGGRILTLRSCPAHTAGHPTRPATDILCA